MRCCAVFSVVVLTAMGFAFAAPPVVKEVFTGKVVKVTDGDSITVLVNKKPVKVRLEGIDAPEARQSFGNRAKQALSRLVAGKFVTVHKTGEDRYGRTLGYVFVGQVEVNSRMVRDGWAWHYLEYNDEERFSELESEAQLEGRGLWADGNAIPPWEFRARQKMARSAATVSPVMSPPSFGTPGAVAASHWINSSSGVRHNRFCEHFGNTKAGRYCGPGEGRACGKCGG